MDIHKNVTGLSCEQRADAHRKDLAVQAKYGVKHLNYWYSANEGTIYGETVSTTTKKQNNFNRVREFAGDQMAPASTCSMRLCLSLSVAAKTPTFPSRTVVNPTDFTDR
jgi:hypothetical protein